MPILLVLLQSAGSGQKLLIAGMPFGRAERMPSGRAERIAKVTPRAWPLWRVFQVQLEHVKPSSHIMQ